MWFIKLLSDKNGNPSSKRSIGFIGAGLLIYLVIMSVQYERAISPEIWGVVTGIIAWVTGMSMFEKKE